ncbi:glycosyltransferase family 2 protein [Bartonella tamiae]|uniref:Glycosyltransferase 2-like domain-containing protein n=1 Tax=Bartonella tamiae Th239 TaxID=1094558 RepID=J0QS61_9HYPH|nr:glycosyltransferase family 2 protein [Bartonella tamiae]EJF88701.1 hypothetical protein ME5_01252 [Bartonella tamiae Th239]EJF95049.1 hypothetical protein MEG_00630 [Bartonella tamiae Th307]
MNKIDIICPVFNEANTVLLFLERISLIFKELSMEPTIIFVDDGSKDKSWNFIKQASSSICHIRSLKLSRNFGKESAIAAGLSVSEGDAVITIDCDLQHPPELMKTMLTYWRDGADIVCARKQERQSESLFDRITANSFYRLFNWITENDIKGSSDFILMDRKVVTALKSLPEKLFFYRGVVHWLGYKHVSIAFKPEERIAGKSGWSFWKKIKLAVDSLTGFSAKPLILIWFLTAFFIFFAVFVAGDALISKFLGKSVSGFSTLILVMLTTGTAILSSLCLLTIYIRQIFYEVKNRPRFFISEDILHQRAKKYRRDEEEK